MKNNLNTIVTIAGFVVLYLVLGNSQPVKVNHTIKEIETRIQYKLDTIYKNIEVVKIKKEYIYKTIKHLDTIHDTTVLVKVQKEVIVELVDVTESQDTIITELLEVDSLNKEVIEVQKVKIKKKNKDIIKMTLIALGAGVVAILK